MTRTLRRFVAVLIVALALAGVFASCAYANLETPPSPTLGTSKSNPGAGADFWWRQGWGNSPFPDFELNPPAAWVEQDDGYLLGTLYTVDQTPGTAINTSLPNNYYRDNFPTAITSIGGTNLNNTLDMLGIYMNPPTGSWPNPPAGPNSVLEGQWYLHYLFYSNLRYQTTQYNVPFGIDMTPPRAVTGLRIRTGLYSADVTTWTPSARAYISWDASQTDSLSGDGYFQVLIDDKPFVPETSSTPTQGRVYSAPGLFIPSSVTIESMPPGAHKVSIQPVDRATNVGPPTSTYFYSDPDTPTIKFTSPVSTVLSNKTLFSVDASDLAGDPQVQFFLDGTSIATLTAPPYSFKPDLSLVGSGDHTLSATVTDHLNRHVTVTKTVGWNNTALSSGFMIFGVPGFLNQMALSSVSNPPGDKWRVDPQNPTVVWGNSLHPDFTLPISEEASDFPINDEGNLTGMLYDVTRAPQLIDQSIPSLYFRSLAVSHTSAGTNLNNTLDLNSLMDFPPAGGWPAPQPGVETTIEGTWYLQYKTFTDSGWAEANTNLVRFGIDVTPPSAPTSLSASPSTNTADAGRVTPDTRMNVTWRTGDYDALSGVAYYRVLVDSQTVIPDGADSQGRVIDIPGRAEPAVTIENLAPGRHTIAVEAVDRASNIGAPATCVVYSDPDTPTVVFTSPVGNVITTTTVVSVAASDAAGPPSVQFLFNGVATGTPIAAPPYSFTPDLSHVSTGTVTLGATATDAYGRHVSAFKTVTYAGSGSSSGGFISSGGPGFEPHAAYTSVSNPLTDRWRVDSSGIAWGNNVHPDFSLPLGSEATTFDPIVEGTVAGMLYDVRRAPELIDQTNPDFYFRSAAPLDGAQQTHLDKTIDLQSLLNYPPVGGWPAPSAGATLPAEGIWYLQYKAFTTLGWAEANTDYIRFGIDLTAPDIPTGLIGSPTTDTALAGAVTPGNRIHFSWNPGVYDALSGVAYYQMALDGHQVIPGGSDPQGRVIDIPGMRPAATIENLTPGAHTVAVDAVDRAGNIGKSASIVVYSDPDTPTVQITSPSGSVVGNSPTLAANASDAGGVVSVVFAINGTTVATTTASPYRSQVDLGAFASGAATLTATVTDRYGRHATDTKAITIDKTPLVLSSVKASGSGRKITVSYKVSRACSVRLALKWNGATMTKVAGSAGSYSIVYTYPRGAKYPSATSFVDSYTLTASDSLGNVVSAKGTVRVTLAKIVKLAGNKIKIIYY